MRHRTSLFLVILLALVACKSDDIDPANADYVTNDPSYEPTQLDTWLSDNFTKPYNIEVKYRWDASEVDLYRTLVPPDPGKVKGVMEVAKRVWIDTYATLAGEAFIKKYCPKQFLLVGSASYNPDGSFTLGTAEGGRKVVLYVVNEFDQTDRVAVKELIHTVEHEFGHILNQNVSYPAAFKEITPGNYTANWNFVSLREARSKGFVTAYAMASPDEDFVEMVSMMLVEGKAGYEAILGCETPAEARPLLRQKEQLVVRYFREAFGIDFYALQTKVQEAIGQLAPDTGGVEKPPLWDVWGFGKEYTSLRFDLSQLSLPAGFLARVNTDNRALQNAGLAFDPYFRLHFTGDTELALQVYYHTDTTSDRTSYTANFYYELGQTADGYTSFQPTWADENGLYLADQLGAFALPNYFAQEAFTVDWEPLSCANIDYVGLHPRQSPANYCFGILGK